MRKTVTPAVLRANQRNASRSTGPITREGKANVSRNALRHGLLCRTLLFKNDGEKTAFKVFCRDLAVDMAPANEIERMLMEELAISWHRLSRAARFEQQLRLKHNPATDAVLGALKGNVAIVGADEALSTERPSSWECTELDVVVSKGDKTGEEEGSFGSPEKENKEHVEIKAKFSNPLETVLRYRRAITKDFYKALNELQRLQQNRMQRD